MAQVDFITRFVAYFPDDGERGREELARAAGVVEKQGLSTLKRDTYLLAVAAVVTTPPAAAMLLDVFPGTAVSARLAAATFGNAPSAESVHDKAEQSAQCYNLLRFTDRSFSVESDALGLKPMYTARTRGGNVIGSRIADLLQLFPSLAQPADQVGLYELMFFWTPLAGRTLHRCIKRTLPGGCYRWSPGAGFTGERGRDIRPAPIEPLRLMDTTIEKIRATAGQSLLDKTAGVSTPVLLGLSGGFDSRLIAALCRDHDVDVRALSYGRRHNEELHSSRAVARALELDLETVHFRADTTLRHLDHHLEITEGTVDPAALSIMNLFEVSSAPGSAILHGYCGDVQAGKLVSRYSAAELSSPESLADAIIRFNDVTTRPELLSQFTPAVDMDEIREDILSGFRTDRPLHQAHMMWEFDNRQRGYVGSQFQLAGGHFDTVMPFYDRRLFDIWTSIPPIGLTNRNVFRELLARRYPALARIPHPEERAPTIPNLRWQLGRFCRRLPKSTLARAVGETRANRIYLRLHRHNDIMHLSKLSAPQQQAYMLSRVATLRPALKDVLGVELSSGFKGPLSSHLKVLRGLFAAAEYAQRRVSATVAG